MTSGRQPKDNPFMLSLLKVIRPVSLQLKFGPVSIKVIDDGIAKLKALNTKRVILCPNHPSLLDADVVFALSDILKEEFNYLAAHVLFYGHKGVNAFFLQHMGCYPVKRGVPDFHAFRTTINVLLRGKRKLVIFPEGEVSHDSDALMTLEPGAAQIALSALEDLQEIKPGSTIYVVPLAIKYFYRRDIRKSLARSLQKLEDEFGFYVADDHFPERIRNATEALLCRLEIEYDCLPQRAMSLSERIQNLRIAILQGLAQKLGITLPASIPHLDWVHFLQKALTDFSSGRLQPPEPTNITKHEFIRSANKDIAHVLNFVSLDRNLPDADSSQEDLAEAIEILEREVLGHAYNKGPRLVLLKVGEPIDLLNYLPEYKQNKKAAIQQVREQMSNQLASMLQEIERRFTRQFD